MSAGRDRKKLIKLSQKIPVEEIRAFVFGTSDSYPQYFVLQRHGIEVLRGWQWRHGVTELTLDDDVLAFAVTEYLKKVGLVFDSDEWALNYAQAHGTLERPPSTKQQ